MEECFWRFSIVNKGDGWKDKGTKIFVGDKVLSLFGYDVKVKVFETFLRFLMCIK